jgi:Spy/CpxP family protein refolding chaperone
MKRIVRKAGIAILGIGVLALGIGCGLRFFHETGDPAWFCGKGHHPRFFHKDMSERVLKRLDSHVKDLDLTENQKEQYAGIRQKLESQLRTGQEMRKRFMADIREEMSKDRPDIQAVTVMLKKEFRKFPEFMEQNIDLFQEFYNILDDGQKAKVIKHFKDRFEKAPFRAGVSGHENGAHKQNILPPEQGPELT